MDKKKLTPNLITDNFPNLLYPIYTRHFLESFKILTDRPDESLRNFNIFNKICYETNTHILIIIDEVENWQSVVKNKLDTKLLSITNSESPSIILIFRSHFPKGAHPRRRSEVFGRFLALWEKLKYLNIPEPKMDQIIEITKGILLTSRLKIGKTLFPLTEDFVVALAYKTRRHGRFNMRLYIRALTEILEKSLLWERESVELTKDFLDLRWIRDTITDIVVSDILKEKETVYLPNKTFLRSIVASEIAEIILKLGCPDTNYLKKLKSSIAKKYNAPIPSNMEIIASVEELPYRRRLQHLIDDLYL